MGLTMNQGYNIKILYIILAHFAFVIHSCTNTTESSPDLNQDHDTNLNDTEDKIDASSMFDSIDDIYVETCDDELVSPPLSLVQVNLQGDWACVGTPCGGPVEIVEASQQRLVLMSATDNGRSVFIDFVVPEGYTLALPDVGTSVVMSFKSLDYSNTVYVRIESVDGRLWWEGGYPTHIESMDPPARIKAVLPDPENEQRICMWFDGGGCQIDIYLYGHQVNTDESVYVEHGTTRVVMHNGQPYLVTVPYAVWSERVDCEGADFLSARTAAFIAPLAQ
jgi:hypothetical protein